MIINYYNDKELCTRIYVNQEEKHIHIVNFTDIPLFRAFGINEHPTWQDFEDFLKERCFPENRHHIELNLRALGLSEYNPLEICKRTNGRMVNDNMWMTIDEDEDLAKTVLSGNNEVER